LNCVTVAPCARKRSLRCTSDTCVAIPASCVAQSNAESPPADDHDALVAVVLRIGDDVVDAATVPGLALACGSRRGENAPIPRRDDDRARREAVLVRLENESGRLARGGPVTRWAEVRRLVELRRLVSQRPHEILGEHLRIARDVEDVFLRIERGELPAELRQRVHDLRRRAAHSRVEEREEPRRPAADDGDVLHLVFHS
jgi:hypothetical protein